MEQVNSSSVETRGDGTYWYRRQVPKALRELVGRKEIRHSLKTKDYPEAHRRAHLRDVELDEEWARLQANSTAATISDDAAERLANEWAAAEVADDWEARAVGRPQRYFRDGEESNNFLVEDILRDLQRVIADGIYDPAGLGAQQARHALRRHGFGNVPESSDDFRKTAFAFSVAAKKLFDILWRRNEGEVPPVPEELRLRTLGAASSSSPAPIVAPQSPLQQPRPASKVRHSMEDLMAHWVQRRSPAEKTKIEARKALRRLQQANGGVHLVPSEVTKAQVLALRNAMRDEGLAKGTAEKTLGLIAAMFDAAIREEQFGVTINPAAKIDAEGKPPVQRRVWPVEELNALFGSPHYARDPVPAVTKIGADAAYWLPLLALFTGARQSELCQLRADDIREEDGVDFIRITNIGEGQRLKVDDDSRRRIPIHADLNRLGFLEFARLVRKEGRTQLFRAMQPDGRGVWGSDASEWFSAYRMLVFGERPKGLDFHSFRHAFKYHARASSIPEDQHDAITGHKNPAVARIYGSSEGYPLRPLREAMDRYAVPGLRLPAAFVCD